MFWKADEFLMDSGTLKNNSETFLILKDFEESLKIPYKLHQASEYFAIISLYLAINPPYINEILILFFN